MNKSKVIGWMGILVCVLLLTGVAPSLRSGQGLAAPAAITLNKWVIGGGGGPAEAPPYTLNDTIGQPVVGGIENSPYQIGAGFWGGLGVAAGGVHTVYLPLVMRNDSP